MAGLNAPHQMLLESLDINEPGPKLQCHLLQRASWHFKDNQGTGMHTRTHHQTQQYCGLLWTSGSDIRKKGISSAEEENRDF